MKTIEQVKLEHLMAERLGSITPSEFPNEEFDLYSIPAFDRGEPEITRGNEIGSAKQIVAPGDVLLSKIVPHIRRSWVVGKDRGKRIIASGEWIVFRGDRFDPEYLKHVLTSDTFHIRFMETVAGVGGSLLRARPSQVAEIKIPLPPLPEQRRIAAILDKADAIRRKREEGIRLTEELLRSTFLEMFGDPATNPKKWPTKAMGDVVQETQYGTAEKSNTDGIGLPVLRMNNITYGGEIDITDLKWCEIKDSDLEQLTVKRGDLLFNRTNSPELVGKTAVWDRDERYAYAGYLFRVRFHENVVLPDYISGFLNSAYGKKMLFAKAKPSNNMSNFSAGEFCRIELPIPDIGIQRRFATVVAEIKRLKDKRAAGLKDATELFGALVQRVFRGELTNGEGK